MTRWTQNPIVVFILFLVLLPITVGQVQAKSSEQTLCILDFNRLGNDSSFDWLKQGLSDMMITTMNRAGRYQIIDRKHLQEVLQEHKLAQGGFLDTEEAINRAEIAGAGMLLLGNFAARQDSSITIQVRLLRLSDQRIMSAAKWQGASDKVLLAPKEISRILLAGLKATFDPTMLEGIESTIPRTIDVARSFYSGMKAFDDGNYPESLGHYLDAALEDNAFLRASKEVLRMYDLLEQSEHSVIFAKNKGLQLKEEDLPHALEFIYAAAETSSQVLKKDGIAALLLEQIVYLAERYEKKTGEFRQAKDFVIQKIEESSKTRPEKRGPALIEDPDIKFRIWTTEIEGLLQYREIVDDMHMVRRDGKWIKEPIPEPNVAMWKTRAQLLLARLYMRLGQARKGLQVYKHIMQDYAFLSDHPLFGLEDRFYWRDGIRLEAHFMILRHYQMRGELIRDPVLMNRLNPVQKNTVFERDLTKQPEPDPRARVWSRRADGGHEYYDFAAPDGYQIDSIVLETQVNRLAKLSVYVPEAKGWPPQFDFSRRLTKFNLRRGAHQKTIHLPDGTRFFSLSFLWGPRWGESIWDIISTKLSPASNAQHLAKWQATFNLSPKNKPRTLETDRILEARKIVQSRARQAGWDDARVLNSDISISLTDEPRQDVFAIDWIVYSPDGDIRIIQWDRPGYQVKIPVTINTSEKEFDPKLVRTHEGTWALFWSRGSRSNPNGYFVATTEDFVHWQTPRRLAFDRGEKEKKPEYSFQIVPIPGQYLMVLEHGLVRYSQDLRHWGTPQGDSDHDIMWATTVKSRDDLVWRVSAVAVDEEISPGAIHPDYGYYVTGDGKKYLKKQAIRVASSVDGIHWSRQQTLATGPEIKGLWAFPVAESQIAVVTSNYNHFLNWYAPIDPQIVSLKRAPIRLMANRGDIQFLEQNGIVFCAHPVRDFIEEREVLLIAQSGKVLR